MVEGGELDGAAVLADGLDVGVGKVGSILEAEAAERTQQRSDAVALDALPGGRLHGGPRVFFFGTRGRDGFARLKADLDPGNVIGLEVDEQRVGPVFRIGIEEQAEIGEVTLLLIIELHETSAALGALAEGDGPQRLAGGVEQGDGRVLEIKAGEPFGAAGDEALDFGVGEIVDETAEFGEVGGQVVIRRVDPFAVGLFRQQHRLALINDAQPGRFSQGFGIED